VQHFYLFLQLFFLSKEKFAKFYYGLRQPIFYAILYVGLGTHLFVKVPRPGDSEVTFSVFESSCRQAATCYYQSNHSKVEAISLSALPKDTTSELAGLLLIDTH